MTDSPKGIAWTPDFCLEDCPYHRVGLPIYPVRYAVLPADIPAPALNAAFAGGYADIDLGETARYGLRKLRSGYLYVYDERLKQLNGYRIDESGTLFKVALGAATVSVGNPPPCGLPAHRGSAMIIAVPKVSTIVRLAFSDVEWTEAVRKKFEDDAALRQKHMTAIDVQLWLKSLAQNGASKIDHAKSQVAEYAVYGGGFEDWIRLKGWTWFKWSSSEASNVDAVAGLLQAADHLMPGKGVLLALPDPTGIAQDLSLLMRERVERFLSNPVRARPLKVSMLIQQMEGAIRNQTELDEIAAADEMAAKFENGTYAASVGIGAPVMALPQPKMAAEYRALCKPEHLKRVADQKWAKYTAKYNESARLEWQKAHDAELKEFDQKYIAPLAAAHARWMKSEVMKSPFQNYFDRDNVASGVVYSATFLRCVADTQDKQPCYDVMCQWTLSAAVDDPDNFLLNAMLSNQRKLAEVVAKASRPSMDWLRTPPWDALWGAYANVMGAESEAGKSVVARLIEQTIAPFMKGLNAALDNGVHWTGITLGMISRKAVVPVEVVGSKKAFREKLIRELLKIRGQELSQNQMQRAMAAEIRRMELQGEPLHGTAKKRWFILIDADQVKAQAGKGSGSLVGTLATADQLESSVMKRWRTVVKNDVRLGVIGWLFQFAALTKLCEDDAKAMLHEKSDARARLVAGLMASGGGAADLVSKILENRLNQGLRLSQFGSILKIGGRALSAAGGVVMVVMDCAKVYSEAKEGNYGMAGFYFFSAGLGVVVTIAAFMSVFPLWGWVAAALLIAVAVLIELFKDNKLQDWLERCYWGKLMDDRYSSADEEERQLKSALEG